MSEINLKKNIIMSGSFRIFIFIFSFLASWVSTRYLGVELRGKLSYLITTGGVIWMVLDLGLYRSFPYLIRKFPEKLQTIFAWSVIMFITEIIVLSLLGISFLRFWNQTLSYSFDIKYIILFVGTISFIKFASQLQGMYLGMNKVLDHSLSQLISPMLSFIIFGVGYFFFRNTDRLAYVLGTILTANATSIIYFSTRNKWGKWWKAIDFRFVGTAYQSGFRVFLSSVFIMLLIRVDIILIKRMLGFSEVGIYSLAAHIVDVLQMASNVVGGLLLVKLTDTEDEVSKWIMMKKMLMVFFVFLSLANLGFIIFGKVLLSVMFGKQFVPVYIVYLWLMPACYGLSFGSLFNNYLNSKNFPVISIVLAAAALFVNVGLNLLLIPIWGIFGAAFATSFAYPLWFVMIIMYEQHCTKGQMLQYLLPTRADWQELGQRGNAIYTKAVKKLSRHA
jgi:O-antigen/teichoic acid export membrane protein